MTQLVFFHQHQSQPPREAVSWNMSIPNGTDEEMPSASSWGCELKYTSSTNETSVKRQPPREAVSWNMTIWKPAHLLPVSLLVRLWVEMDQTQVFFVAATCQPPREAVSWNSLSQPVIQLSIVSLLVRLWVEISEPVRANTVQESSASSWGCELKSEYSGCRDRFLGQPPREAVSWNATTV